MSSSSSSGRAAARGAPTFLSIGTKLTVPVVVLVATVAFAAYFGVARTSRVNAMHSKAIAADMVVRLTSLSVAPAVVFADAVEMQRAVHDLARDPEVLDVELWAFDPAAARTSEPLASFHRQAQRSLGRPRVSAQHRELDADSLTAVEPVVSLEGQTIAALVVRFSTARESAALAQLTRDFLYFAVGMAVCLAAAILLVIRRVVVAPLQTLQHAARRLAAGESESANVSSKRARTDDEVGQLMTTFGEMAEAVRDREAHLAKRNAELGLILDSVDQGFLTARPDGVLLPQHSAVVDEWLGALPNDSTVWTLAECIDPLARDWTEVAWTQLCEGILPLEVALAQLPKRLSKSDRHFDLAFHPVMNGESIEQVVIVLTDVTVQVERQQALAEQHEFSVLVDYMVRDRRAFREFWLEASELTQRIVNAPTAESAGAIRRDIHTLKGNARFCGLSSMAARCHALEDALKERGTNVLTQQERRSLGDLWAALRARIEPLMDGVSSFVEVSEGEYRRLLDAIRQRVAPEQLEILVRGLSDEPTVSRLKRAKDMLGDACAKFGKSAPEVTIDDNDLRLPPRRWADFALILPLVLSNAADHGIEPDAVRIALGKPVPARIRLGTQVVNGQVVVEVSDDGCGIDWERVRTLAKERGLAHANPQDLERALFSEGFSLKATISESSGRGVGLSAVREVIQRLGGKIELETEPGRGTTWRFRYPIAERDDASDTSKLRSHSGSLEVADTHVHALTG